MTGLEKVTARILSEAEEDAGKLLRSAEEKSASIAAEADEKIALMRKASEEEILAESESIFSRAESSAAMQKRNIILKAKGEALDRAFAEAEAALCSLPEGEYLSLLSGIARPVLTGAGGTCSVRLNREDAARVGKALIKKLSSDYPKVRFTLSDEPAKISGGMLLDLGDIDADCSIAALVAEHRAGLEPTVCDVLFEIARKVST